MKKSTIWMSLILILSIALAACGNGEAKKTETDRKQVVVTNSILYDMTKEIAGDKVDVHSIVPVGKDPHDYEVLPEDIKKATDADLILYNGLNLETGGDAWFTKLMNNANKKENRDYFAVSEGVEPLYLEGKNADGKEDPHAWLSLENGMIYVNNITQKLVLLDKDNKDYYAKNAADYTQKLMKLHQEAKEKFSKIPKDKRMVITSEGSFKYFSLAYQIPSAYIWEINTEEEGTPDQIKNLVDQLRKSKVPALFVESSVDDRPMKTISKETGIPIHAKIFTDSISEKGDHGDSYYNMMKWNFDQIYDGLMKK